MRARATLPGSRPDSSAAGRIADVAEGRPLAWQPEEASGAGHDGLSVFRAEGLMAPVSQVVVKRPPRALPPEVPTEEVRLEAPPELPAGSRRAC